MKKLFSLFAALIMSASINAAQFEGVIKYLKQDLPESADCQKVHVAFMGNDMAVPMAKAYATMIALDTEDNMIPAMFAKIHEMKQTPRDEAELRQVFIDNGLDAKKFDATYNGFAVNSMQKRFDKQLDASTLTGVPGVLVNNKYIVKPEKITRYEEYNPLVNYLLTL
ncbi:thiol:disulfide interchange protein DsbA/DsbL [Vibrio sp. nBUS_14]|uniref:thiol:disulfide interchange protein DsbA/DsbL n=1 Tax=unclassified Vibrio TaxID=2614977 RepID=UPI003EC0684B